MIESKSFLEEVENPKSRCCARSQTEINKTQSLTLGGGRVLYKFCHQFFTSSGLFSSKT